MLAQATMLVKISFLLFKKKYLHFFSSFLKPFSGYEMIAANREIGLLLPRSAAAEVGFLQQWRKHSTLRQTKKGVVNDHGR